MPMQMIRASKGYAKAHISENLWLWMGVFAAATLVLGLLQLNAGTRNVLGDLASFAGMVLGILVMVQSQKGFVSSHVAPVDEDDEADLPTPATPPSATV